MKLTAAIYRTCFTGIALFLIAADLQAESSSHLQPWNNPYPAQDARANIYYTSFTEQPKTLDPALSNVNTEALFLAQVCEPPLQYHYLKRPYTVVPLTAVALPTITYLDSDKKPLSSPVDSKKIAYSLYTLSIQPGIYYQPHPAFARKKNGTFYYHPMPSDVLKTIKTLSDFPERGTRELTADDYVYEIKRLGQPKETSPLFGLMSTHIVGLGEFSIKARERYQAKIKHHPHAFFFDLRDIPLEGVKSLNRYTYQILLKGEYPQFIYWLTMPFFAPIPWEADDFYSQPGMQEKNITLAWYPVGTGPYMLIENNPNRRMVLKRNPNFHPAFYPTEGSEADRQAGLLEDAGKRLPFIDTFVFNLERENIPRWNKFLQGYYDQSGLSTDSFDQAVQINKNGQAELTDTMRDKQITLQVSPAMVDFYMGFNYLDPVVGGDSEPARKLRQAISIALDQEEYIAIFLNGRGTPAQDPIPPGVFGHREGKEGINPYVYEWRNHRIQLRSIESAKRLLSEAGYPNGRDPKTGQTLILYYDTPTGAHQDDAAIFTWLRKRFELLGLHLQIRDTQYNRFEEKMRTGHVQIFFGGWIADYPDPENFLMLLYGPNGKVKYAGENSSNYNNSKYNQLFNEMKNLPNGPQRQRVINQMLEIIQHDAPWVFGFHPENFQLSHSWLSVSKPGEIIYNTLKYRRLNPLLREKLRTQWNPPEIKPLFIGLAGLLLIIAPVIMRYRRKQHKKETLGQAKPLKF